MATGVNVNSLEEKKYSLIQQITSESINVDKIDAFSLYYFFDKNILLIGIVDNDRGKYILFEKYSIDATLIRQQNIADFVLEIIENHTYLKAGFWKNIRVCFDNQNFTLVPNSLFEPQKANLYLNQTKKTNEQQEVCFYNHLSLNAVNVFNANFSILETLKKTYPLKHIEVIHSTSSFIEGCFKEQLSEETNVMINISDNNFILVIIKNSKLILCNSFNFKTKEDFVYYLMFSLKELNLDPEQIVLKLWGEITYNSNLYNFIYKYIRNVEIGGRPSYLNFSYQFDELLEQRYFILFSQHLCQ